MLMLHFFEENNKKFRIFGYEDENGKKHSLDFNKLMDSPNPDKMKNDFIDEMVKNLIES